MSKQQISMVSQEIQKTLHKEQRDEEANQQIMTVKQKQSHAEQNQVVVVNNVDRLTERSFISKGASRGSEGIYEEIVPLSHQKRERSLSPIKRENSIVMEENPSITFMRRNTHANIGTIPISHESLQPQRQSILPQSTTPPLLFAKNSQPLSSSIIHTSFKQQPQPIISNIPSTRKSSNKRPQIFSSNKKQVQTNLQLNRNTVAEQIFTLNKQQRTINRHQIYQQIQRQSGINYLTPSINNTKSKRQQVLTLSLSKRNEIKKLQVISASPRRATEQYWQGVYPQSKKYLNSLKATLVQQKQLLNKWQSQLQTTLRQNLYQVQQILLQKLYEISRQCVKSWIHQQLQNLQALWNNQFGFIKNTQLQIKSNQSQLEQYDKLLEELNKSFMESHQTTRALIMFEKGIYSAEINRFITQMSDKVKEVVLKSEGLVTKMCQDKLNKAKNIHQYNIDVDNKHSNHNRLHEVIDTLLTNLSKHYYEPQQQAYKIITTPSHKHSKSKTPSSLKPNFDIGQKIKMILNKSQHQQPQTTRPQIIIKQFEYSDNFIPYSQRKYHHYQTPVIKNNQKQFQQYKYEFQKRKKSFITDNNNSPIETDKHKKKKAYDYINDSIIQSQQQKKHYQPNQPPISQRSNPKSTTFDQKLTNLFKKIAQQKQDQPQPQTNRSSIQTNNFNDYNELIRKKKKQNRQNFFRYTIQ